MSQRNKNNRLKGQDVVVAAVLFAHRARSDCSHGQLASELGLGSGSAVRFSESISRLSYNGLYSKRRKRIKAAAFCDFLCNAFRWLFPDDPGEFQRGIPISHAGPGLKELMVFEHAFVWPSHDAPGAVEGRSVKPIHPSAVQAALRWSEVYKILSLAEALRVGRVREKNMARQALSELIVG